MTLTNPCFATYIIDEFCYLPTYGSWLVTLFCSCFVFSISKTLSLVYWFHWRRRPYVTCLCNIHQQNDSELRLRPLCSVSIIQAVYEYKSKWLMMYLHNAKSSTNKGGHTNDSSPAVRSEKLNILVTELISTTCKHSLETSVWNCFGFDVFAFASLKINLFENLLNVKSLKFTSIHYTSEIFLCFLPSAKWEDVRPYKKFIIRRLSTSLRRFSKLSFVSE